MKKTLSKTLSKTLTMTAIAGSIAFTGTTAFSADTCDVEASGTYGIVSNSQPAFITFQKELQKCKGVKVDWKILVDNKAATYEGFLAPKSPLAGAMMSSSQFGQYQAEGLVMPITNIVEKYRSKYPYLTDDMLIKVNGEVYGVAFVTNLQHFIYRKDLFEKYGLDTPTTYKELLADLKIIKSKGEVDYPFGAAYKSGWNLGTEFVNLYLSTGQDLFKSGTSLPNVNTKDARRVLKTMKKLYSYASPNSLSLASGDVVGLFQSGEVAAMQMWASRAAKVEDPKLSKVIGKIELSSALKLSKKDPYTASSMFWDGFAIPKGTQNDPEKTFQLFMELIDKETVMETSESAVWLSPFAKVQKYSKGIIETRQAGVRAFPSSPQFNLLHAVIGKNIGDFLSGQKSGSEVLKKIERTYKKVAKEKGFL